MSDTVALKLRSCPTGPGPGGVWDRPAAPGRGGSRGGPGRGAPLEELNNNGQPLAQGWGTATQRFAVPR
ncbi:hypothetical protein NDU88_003787 [Pleurodeles waltl]|uniref:Uncharacterized protein n=1 Tax=Pleurodeles waltl TaxID=8319 RepID=A0AAV7V2S7_PLEWA|nr:hypothetical protein NDU88_003787 [Pleurodeles waltl]